VRSGSRQGLRALAHEEDIGRELVLSLDERQLAAAPPFPTGRPMKNSMMAARAIAHGLSGGGATVDSGFVR
jgi:hypothetical protein